MEKIIGLSFPKTKVVGLLGNVLDHFDTALYGFLAPYIAPLIFPESSPVVQLIKTYGLMSASIATRPLGAWFFGYMAARYGSKFALSSSLTGLALVTCAMGLIPSYAEVGELAPLILAFLRILQGFFAAGEMTIAPFFLLELEQPEKRGFADSMYGSSTVLGELLASFAAVLVSVSKNPELFWRLPFLASALTAFVGIYLRLKIPETNILYEKSRKPINFAEKINGNKAIFLKVIFISGLSYITYSIPFIFFNNFIPQITDITYSQMIQLNISLLAMDMFMFPLFGWLSDRINPARLMALMAALLTIAIIPLFLLLNQATLITVSSVRVIIILIGLGFNAPLHAWFMTQYPGPERYTIIGLGYSLGSELFGRSAPALCLMLWHITKSPLGPAFYLASLAFLCTCGLVFPLRKQS